MELTCNLHTTTVPAPNLLRTQCADGGTVWTGWANGMVVTHVTRFPWTELTVVPFAYPTWYGVALVDQDGQWQAVQYARG